jgi:membrane fusion protein (multidrug efflux system)
MDANEFPGAGGRHGPAARARAGLGLLAAALVAAPAGCNRPAEARREPPAPVVGVVEARVMDVPLTANPNATTRALNAVSIRARVRGTLQEIHFTEGADVAKDQLLFVIEEAPYKATVAAAEAKVAEAEAAVQKAKDSKAREIARAQVAVDQAELALARVEESRQRQLLSRNAASQQDVDRASATRQRNEAQVEADLAKLRQAEVDYDVDIRAAEATLAGAQAELDQARIDLSYCRLASPIVGRIGEAEVKAGNLVGPMTGTATADFTELATIQQLDPMGIDIQVSSRYLERATQVIARGLEVHLSRPGLEGMTPHPYAGRAFFIDNRIDPTTSTFLVKAQVPNPGGTLLPGEYVKLDMIVGTLPDAVVVPEQAVLETQGGEMVYAVGEDGVVEVARVVAGETYRGLRVIKSGLEPGRKVIVEGIQLARPGLKVRAEPAAWPDATETEPPDAGAAPERASHG